MTDDTPDKPSVNNEQIAHILKQIAGMLEFQDENAFKLKAYSMAAETIDSLQVPIAEMVERGGAAELQKIPGIGKGISSQIVEIVHTGGSTYLDELSKEVPLSVLDLRRVSGIGLKTAQLLYKDFGVKSLEGLSFLLESGGLKSVPGLGEKSIDRIKRSLDRLKQE
ncbi:MAG TPA: helix-hairpin-helix domain-containing protein [Blastocatellia bacterium]|nr:helix-hairpin-helix domain-containing protein [Blastocatellia bacterium]